MFQIRNRPQDFLLFFSLTLFSMATCALPSDRKEKVYIESDSSIYNYKTGINTFEGHVKIDQGTTHIIADKLITKNNPEHKMNEAIAYGQQALAHYWTQPKLGDKDMHAYARIIKFYPIESNVTLEHEVFVTQGENSFHGELIHYNNSDQTITVPPTKKGQSIIVYNPEN